MKIIKPQTFSPFTFSRASQASYYNNVGNLVFAANDVLRQGYDPTTLAFLGPILEGAETNHFIQSNNFNLWTIGYQNTTPVLSPGAANGPTGTATATLLDWDGVGYIQLYQQYNPGGGTANIFRVFSVYLKAKTPGTDCTVKLIMGSAEGVFNIRVGSHGASGPNTAIQVLPNGWFRCSIYAQQVGSQIAYIRTVLGSFYLYGAQVETSKVPSSYITSVAAKGVRAADVQLSPSPSVVSTNVAENEAPVWDVATAYTAGTKVMVLGAYHRVYEAITTNTGNSPPTSPSFWLDTGPTNPWLMFDMKSGADRQTTATAGDGSIDVTLAVTGPVDAVVLLNVEGSTVSITVRNGDGEVIGQFDGNSMSLPLDTGWWDFFFGQRPDSNTFIYTDFSLLPGQPGTIRVRVEGGGGVARIGKLIVGDMVEIGCVKFGSSGGIIDFSKKTRDDFGNTTILERRYIDKFDYDVLIETQNAYNIKTFLADIRATPAVYIGSENHLITVVFGFYRDFSIILQGPKFSACALQVEGL